MKAQTSDIVLIRYTIERLPYRSAQSPHTNRFVLKGTMLLMAWFDEPFCSSCDFDLLGRAIWIHIPTDSLENYPGFCDPAASWAFEPLSLHHRTLPFAIQK